MGSVADQPSRVHRSPAVRRRPAVSGPPATPQDVSGLTVSGVLARHRPTELCSAGRAPQSLLGGPLVVRRASLPRGSRRCLQTRGGGRPRASWTWSGEVDTISRVKAIYRVGQIVLLTGEMAVMRSWIRPLLAGTVLVAASCTASQHESPPSLGEIRIGLLAPLSGEAKAAGTDAVHGAQLAAAMLNGEDGTQLRETRIGVPGLQGSAVRIIPADTRNKPDPAVVEAVHLVDKADVAGLVGAYDPDVTAAASQRTERLGIPFVNGDASAGYLTERGLDWFFRTGPTDRMFGEAFLSTLKEQQAGRSQTGRIALLYATDELGNGLHGVTTQLAAEGGYVVVPRNQDGTVGVGFKPGTPDLTAAVAEVRAAQPDAVFLVASSPTDAGRLLGTFGTLAYTPPGIFTFGAGFLDQNMLNAAGPNGEGLLFSAAWSREVAG